MTGGGQEMTRAYAESVYGIPPEQVVGSSILTKYEYRDGRPVLMREPKLFFHDDFAGKAIGINLFIGKRPYAAFGNSQGDRQMLEWTQAGGGARLMMLVYHDDADREYAYGPAGGLRDSKVGTFPQSLMDEAQTRGWTGDQHEERLEKDLSLRQVASARARLFPIRTKGHAHARGGHGPICMLPDWGRSPQSMLDHFRRRA